MATRVSAVALQPCGGTAYAMRMLSSTSATSETPCRSRMLWPASSMRPTNRARSSWSALTCAKFIRLAHEADLKATFLNVSFVGSHSLAAELGALPARVIVTQVVPHPLDADTPI